MSKIFMKRGLQAAYDALPIKDPDTLYITLDTGRLFLGSLELCVRDPEIVTSIFYFEGVEVVFIPGTTWEQFIKSEYNTIDAYKNNTNVFISGRSDEVVLFEENSHSQVLSTDKIIENSTYYLDKLPVIPPSPGPEDFSWLSPDGGDYPVDLPDIYWHEPDGSDNLVDEVELLWESFA